MKLFIGILIWSGSYENHHGLSAGCRLKTPKGQETRPTSDRVKESLFNILGQKVSGRHVLDIFAGTGNLGLEALSRDAADACFVDQATAALIKENAAHAHLLERAEVHGGDVFAELSRFARAGRSFDLIFCDPPYHKGLFEQALVFLTKVRYLPMMASLWWSTVLMKMTCRSFPVCAAY